MEATLEDPPTSAVVLDHCHFSQVIFNSVEKFYVPGGDVTCYYTLTQHFIPRQKDWIGIFRVGWKTTREYYTFMWVTLPNSNSTPDKQQEVTFKAYYLPKDDEYYQFCYVDQDGVVRGASIPFQFRPENEEDILVVTTQGEVEELEQHNNELRKENQELKHSCASLQEQNADGQAELQRKQEELEALRSIKQKLEGKLKEQRDSWEAALLQLKEQNQKLSSENEKMGGRVDQLQKEHQQKLERTVEELKQKEATATKKQQELTKARNKEIAVEEQLVQEVDRLKAKEELEALRSIKQKLEGKLKEQRDSWEAALLQLKEQNQKLSSENEKMGGRVDQLQAQLSTQEKEMKKLVQEDQDKTEQLEYLKKKNGQLFLSLSEQKEHQQKLERTVEELKQKEATATKKQQELTEARNKEIAVEEQLVQEVDWLKAKDQNFDLSKRLSENKIVFSVLQREKERLEGENDYLKRENSRLMSYMGLDYDSVPFEAPTSDQGGAGQNPALVFGNPYSGIQESSAPSLLSIKKCPTCKSDLADDIFDYILQQQQPIQTLSLNCPICDKSFSAKEKQIFEDHVFCHSL